MSRYALTVGINDYPDPSARLSGCVNDARDLATLLAGHNYLTTVLLDADATRANIAEALRELVAKARFGDRIVFTNSSHGTWLPDRDGDEADGRDEALCCYDYAAGGLLLDDEMQAIFGELRYGARALVLSDSCHSGTVSRFMATGQFTPAAHSVARFLPPETFYPGLTASRATVLEQAPASTPRRTASLISGCGDLEFSYDAWFGGRPNGAFTRAALDAYTPGMTLAGWYAAIRKRLPSTDYPQTPQLTASAYRRYTKAL